MFLTIYRWLFPSKEKKINALLDKGLLGEALIMIDEYRKTTREIPLPLTPKEKVILAGFIKRISPNIRTWEYMDGDETYLRVEKRAVIQILMEILDA